MKNFKYIGPAYSKGIRVHGVNTLLRPAQWDDKLIRQFRKDKPELFADWFEEVKAKKAEAKTAEK